ncbi:flagellar filament capping protein FliD [Solibacillus sp. FSL W8-0474]|uniref:flagellar filament capping protein FliD n=1 Tax=Solibacillus sp. FSL W8-0474 TaxID=2975336 RepID=UPI0030F6F27A
MSGLKIGGLASGMDIDSIVEKLMVAERMPVDKLEQQKQIYEWQRDAYRDVNKKMTTLDTYIADNFILKSLNTKTATSSNSDLVSSVATGSASGSLSIEGVSQLAEAERWVGTQKNATSSTKLSDLFAASGKTMPENFTLSAIDTQGNLGKPVSIGIDANTTISELITKINGSNAGVSAIFENGKLSLTAKNTGKEVNNGPAIVADAKGKDLLAELGITESGKVQGKNAIFQVNGIATERTTNTFSMNGYNITLKSVFNEGTAYANALKAAEESEKFGEENLKKTLENLNKIYNVGLTGSLSDQFVAMKAVITTKISELQTKVDVAKATLASARDIVFEEGTAGELYDKLSPDAKTALGNAANYNDLTKDMTEEDLAALAGLNSTNFDALQDVHTKAVVLEDETKPLNDAKKDKTSLETMEANYRNAEKALENLKNNPLETKVEAKAVTMTSSTNVDEIMNKVKEFVATYNGFIKDLTDQTKQPKYRDFKPLTALQKKGMEQNEIDQWEERAKSGLLKSDSIITSGLSSLRGLVYQTNHAVTNQKYNALYTIGIGTSKDYNSGGTLEIDEMKLRKALEEDPDAVVQLLTMSGSKSATVTKADGSPDTGDTRGFMRKIRDELEVIEKKIDERAGRGTMNETQYTLGKYLRNVNQSLDAWKNKLTAIESRYWKQFGAMEAMINKANSQSASLMSQYY